jgi:hypothetical protein
LQIIAEVAGKNGGPVKKLTVALDLGHALVVSGIGEAACHSVVEIAIAAEDGLNRVRLSFWQDGLPIQAVPPQDYLEITEPPGWSA